ncbi:MAG TPA: GGDEF domain-containing protein [Burkholderiaceae bacterium]|jgi:diguanylate cyclase (GGDEF)-like protein
MSIADRGLLAACHRFARGAALALLAVGVVVLIGWMWNIEILRSVIPGLVPMNPVSAICFMLAGVTLFNSGGASARRSPLAVACAVLVLCVGALRLLGYVSPLDVRLDRWLFSDRLAGNTMAPNTALNFCIDGIALTLLALGVALPLAQLLAMFAAVIAFMALLGYVFDVPLFGLPGYIPMALNSALCFLAVELGLLASTAEKGAVLTLVSRLSGGRMVRRLLPAVVLLPFVLGLIGDYGVRRHWFAAQFAMALVVTFSIVGMLALLVLLARWLNRDDIEIERLLTTDTLTGLLNRRTLMEELGNQTAAAIRYRLPLATAMVDLDHFKQINDGHGHAVGDRVLQQLGSLIKSSLRETDVAGRYGGEEFVIVLPHTDQAGALVFGERLRHSISEMVVIAGGKQLNVTCSIGIAQVIITDTPQPELALALADQALYVAKREGRNRVHSAHGET